MLTSERIIIKFLRDRHLNPNSYIFPRKKITFYKALEAILSEEAKNIHVALKCNRSVMLSVFRDKLDITNKKSTSTKWKTFVLEEVGLKYCPDCSKIKDLQSFGSNKNNKSSNIQFTCKTCDIRRSSKWAKDNKDLARLRNAKRRAREKRAVPGWYGELDDFIYKEMIEQCRELEQITEQKYHIDHIVPLTNGGLHWYKNWQILTSTENSIKGSKMPEEWENYKNAN